MCVGSGWFRHWLFSPASSLSKGIFEGINQRARLLFFRQTDFVQKGLRRFTLNILFSLVPLLVPRSSFEKLWYFWLGNSTISWFSAHIQGFFHFYTPFIFNRHMGQGRVGTCAQIQHLEVSRWISFSNVSTHFQIKNLARGIIVMLALKFA